MRLYIDYRELNKVTIKNRYPLWGLMIFFDQLQGVGVFFKIDLKSWYHQLKIKLEDVGKTAFKIRHEHYKFLIYSKNKEEHENHLRIVLHLLREKYLYAKFKKCEIWLVQVGFLEHIITKEGISVDPVKIEASKDWPRFINVTEVRSFLGLIEYYHRFMEEFSRIALSLAQLTKKDFKFHWGERQDKRFQELKDKWTITPVLTMPSETEGYIIYNDASKLRLWCVLMQHDKVIACASRQLRNLEKNYPTHDLELAVVIFALKI